MATPLATAAGTGDTAIIGARRNLRLIGYSVSESASSAAAAECILRHGTSVSDPQLVSPINCNANGFGMFWLGGNGINCPNGIFLDRVSGNTTLVVYVAPLEATT